MMAHASYVFISHSKNSDNNKIQNLTQNTQKVQQIVNVLGNEGTLYLQAFILV